MKKISISICCFLIIFQTMSCKENNEMMTEEEPNINMPAPPVISAEKAEIISVSASGDENRYTFSVGIKSPDTGCGQYADWWEVISETGELIYRRILAHSHVNEQPFTRSGGTVAIGKDQVVFVRAHMNNSGYGTQVFKGSVSAGFSAATTEADFAVNLATIAPLPNGCAF